MPGAGPLSRDKSEAGRAPSDPTKDRPGSTLCSCLPCGESSGLQSQAEFSSKMPLCGSALKPSPCALFQVLGIHLNKWRLDRKLGVYVLVLYAVFLCFSIMIEFNVFTFVNLPMCREDD